MSLFEITMPITAVLIIESASEHEAMSQAEKIVADLTDKSGNYLESEKIISFETNVKVSENRIKNLKK